MRHMSFACVSVRQTCELSTWAPVSHSTPLLRSPAWARLPYFAHAGAKEHGVDPAYVAMLDAHPAYDAVSETAASVAKWTMAGITFGLLLPLAPVVAGTMVYRRCVLWEM
jgi:hypothetical protein